MDPETEAAIVKLHEAYELVRHAVETLGHPASLILGPTMDLLANAGDLVEHLATGGE